MLLRPESVGSVGTSNLDQLDRPFCSHAFFEGCPLGVVGLRFLTVFSDPTTCDCSQERVDRTAFKRALDWTMETESSGFWLDDGH